MRGTGAGPALARARRPARPSEATTFGPAAVSRSAACRSHTSLPGSRAQGRGGAAAPAPAARPSRRALLGAALLFGGNAACPGCRRALALTLAGEGLPPPPDRAAFDPRDPALRAAAKLGERSAAALDAGRFGEGERLLSDLIATYSAPKYDGRPWRDYLLGRAYGDRANVRARDRARLEAALGDYDEAARLSPWDIEPALNRGVVLEAMGRPAEALAAYEAVLRVAPREPAAWNNVGNVHRDMRRYQQAEEAYCEALKISPDFFFANANLAQVLLELGEERRAELMLKGLVRKYQNFDDANASLAALLWSSRPELAEDAWSLVGNKRLYRDLEWLEKERRWTPTFLEGMQRFQALK